MYFVEHFVCFVLTIVILLKYLIYVCNKYCHDIKIYTYTIYYVIRTSYNKNNKAQVSSTRRGVARVNMKIIRNYSNSCHGKPLICD